MSTRDLIAFSMKNQRVNMFYFAVTPSLLHPLSSATVGGRQPKTMDTQMGVTVLQYVLFTKAGGEPVLAQGA